MGRRALRKINGALDLSRHLLWPEAWLPEVGAALPDAADVAEVSAVAVVDSSAPPPEGSVLPRHWTREELFGRRAPLEIEVGSGKGLFLARAAAERPEHDFLGIEMAKKYAHFAAARLVRQEADNARMLCGDALALFRGLSDDAGLAAVHVYFPDPWWKKRHRKRRVLNAPFVRDVERTLESGGALHFWTDVEEYFQETLELIAAETRLEGPRAVPERPAEGNLDYRTHFERRTRLSEQPVYRAEFRKR